MIKNSAKRLDDRQNVCYEFQMNQENPEQIMHTFDDGLIGTILKLTAGRRGRSNGALWNNERELFFRLERKTKERKTHFVYYYLHNENSETIYQIKGRANTCPPGDMASHSNLH